MADDNLDDTIDDTEDPAGDLRRLRLERSADSLAVSYTHLTLPTKA